MYIDLFLSPNQSPTRIDSEEFHLLSQQISRNSADAPNAYFLEQAQFKPVVAGHFIGDVTQGGACNCEDITFNAHGNGTHTECVGHISKESAYMNEVKLAPYLSCQLIHAKANTLSNGDRIIDMTSFNWLDLDKKDAVIVHSGTTHKSEYFSGKNPCYIDKEVLTLLNKKGIDHILTDLPSVDREEDEGILAGHKAFFGYPEQIHLTKTITELLYIPSNLKAGNYVLNISFAHMETDAVPSAVKIYPILR